MQGLLAIATRLGDRRGRAKNQPILLGGVGLRRVARSGLVLNRAEGKEAQAYRPVLQGDRQECLSLPDAVAAGTFPRNALGGGEWGTNRYFLPNKANKSFGINNSSSEEVKKATRRRNETTDRGVINGFWLLQRGWEIGGGGRKGSTGGGKRAQGWGQTALAGWMPALPGAEEKEHRPTDLYSKGTGRNACPT